MIATNLFQRTKAVFSLIGQLTTGLTPSAETSIACWITGTQERYAKTLQGGTVFPE